MKIFLLVSLLLITNLFADFKEGENIFKNKCSSCHQDYISINTIKENFFEKENKLLNLKAPTVNMLVYAIMDSPKKIGDSNDSEMQSIEIESYLKSYLENPDRFNSICDDYILGFYDNKKSMETPLNDEEYKHLTTYFMEYKDNFKDEDKIEKEKFSKDENKILEKAKNENKQILVYATAKSCFFCKKMDREVLELNEVKDKIEKDYIFVKVDMDESLLPFDLQKVYKKITPSFFFVSKEGEFITQYPGSWTKSDFLEILKENKIK
ncbi:thioredoxin family protein [Arcobacter cloacae]|uniref:Thioredoxin family protein n=1 Tax=Arcobacter cloacae TaxID=1054034 RepID=A0A6M8NNV3_9BACT|nr:thioredoxin family protein [Arcobacter cloacae]QKF89214.1 thioredoxin family protein (Thioredoxin_2 domain) [Arcobacter cloacae]RXI42570.1 thioredoxin family protein [Arcobacter cloacae]